jgi:hypothetical protein
MHQFSVQACTPPFYTRVQALQKATSHEDTIR